MNGVQTRFKCKLDVKRCKRFVFPPSSLLPRSNALKTKAIRYFQTDRTLTRIVSPPLPTLDLLPTLCDLAGIPVPAEKAGISLAPTLKGEKQKKTHPYVVSEWHSEYEYTVTPGRMVRGPRYKYTHYLEGNGEELYDMKNDPGERKNLAKNPKYAKVLAEHRAMLDDYITRSKDNYRSLKVDADPRCRNHTPGYPNHEGPSARDIIKRK